ncbi:MAG: caspase family protein [Chitinophagales bacterium]|nr:caspase family protein [Chitinophagales bacterium]
MRYYVFLFLTTILLSNNILFAQKKIALIVAIGKYPPEQRYWKNLSSERDLVHIKNALLKNGFEEKNIKTLVNEQATKNGMIKALNELANNAKSGDIVYFHFSGHGQQIQDDPNDGYLDEADGYDEALIPYDAKGKWDIVDYHGEKHFRDDLLEEKLNAIRKKVGQKGSVVVVLDACHSGTATRSAGIVRGVPEPCQSYNYKPNITLDLGRQEVGFLDNVQKDMGSLVVFSGSSPNQPNRETIDDEGKNVGSLSYAFAKNITSLPVNCNYKFLFDKIKATIQSNDPTQIPMFEGNGALEVFGNKYTPIKEVIIAEPRFNKSEYGFNDTTFIIQRGLYNNIHEGTTLNVYVLGSNELYSKAVVKEVSSFQSICVSDKRLLPKTNYEVKIESQYYGAIEASYLIQNNAGANNLEKQINRFLKPQSFLLLNNNPDYTINIQQEENQYLLQVIERNDSIRYATSINMNDSLTTDDLEEMLEKIKKGMRVEYLRKMQDGGSIAPRVEVSIITYNKSNNHNEIILNPKDSFALKIKSNYDGILYYTILDLLPDNDVKVLVPDTMKNANDADYSIRKDQEKRLEMFTDETSITGKEFLKIIISPYPIDLRPSFMNSRVRSINAKTRPLEKMMDNLFPKDKNTATRSTPIKMDDIGIITVGFTLKKSE